MNRKFKRTDIEINNATLVDIIQFFTTFEIHREKEMFVYSLTPCKLPHIFRKK